MDGQFGGWRGENEPAVAGVNGGEFQDIAEESADGVDVFAVEDSVHAEEHGSLLFRRLTSR
jgi:hypothetical protein